MARQTRSLHIVEDDKSTQLRSATDRDRGQLFVRKCVPNDVL